MPHKGMPCAKGRPSVADSVERVLNRPADCGVVAADSQLRATAGVDRDLRSVELAVAHGLRLGGGVRQDNGLNQVAHVAVEHGPGEAEVVRGTPLPANFEVGGPLRAESGFGVAVPKRVLYNSKMTGNANDRICSHEVRRPAL